MKESFCPDAAILRSSLGAYEDAPGNRYFSLVSELDADARFEGEAGRALDADHRGDQALAFVELDRHDVTARDRRMEGDRSVEDGIQGRSARAHIVHIPGPNEELVSTAMGVATGIAHRSTTLRRRSRDVACESASHPKLAPINPTLTNVCKISR